MTGGQPRASGRRSALLIATSEYDDPEWAPLRSPGADVKGLAEVLADPAIGAFEVVSLHNESFARVRTELDEFLRDREPADFLLLYFSCHGHRTGGEFYLAARDTRKRGVVATGVEATFVRRLLAASNARRVVVVLDCCFSGAFPGRPRGAVDGTAELPEFLSGAGQTIITASSAIEYAYEESGTLISSAPAPSVFTEALVHGLRTGLADLNGDGQVTADEWFDYASARLRGRNAAQTPQMWNTQLVGKLAVARNPYLRRQPPLVAAPAGQRGLVAVLAEAAARLPAGEELAMTLADLVGQVGGVLGELRTPTAWRRLLLGIDRLSAAADPAAATAEVVAAARPLSEDPNLVAAVSAVLDAVAQAVSEPPLADALGELLLSARIVARAAQNVLDAFHTRALVHQAGDLMREWVDTVFDLPAEQMRLAAAGRPPTAANGAAELVEAVYRLAHTLRGFAGHDALHAALAELARVIRLGDGLLAPAAPALLALAECLTDLARRLGAFTREPARERLALAFRDELTDRRSALRAFAASGASGQAVASELRALARDVRDLDGALADPAPLRQARQELGELREPDELATALGGPDIAVRVLAALTESARKAVAALTEMLEELQAAG